MNGKAALLALLLYLPLTLGVWASPNPDLPRERISINEGWRFHRYTPQEQPDGLFYDKRPEVTDTRDDKPADSMPTGPDAVSGANGALKAWILPTGNEFLQNPSAKTIRPTGNPGAQFPFVLAEFDDQAWEKVDLPHDWAIQGPFYVGDNVPVGGGMGRLPVQGVAWYRKKVELTRSDEGKSIFLDVDGAMSYAMVWCNGKLVGGWPYGYSSWRLDLTPYLHIGKDNQLAIRLDNPANSSRWYPGGGIYRNVWLTKTGSVRVGHWGSRVLATKLTNERAEVAVRLQLENADVKDRAVRVQTVCYLLKVGTERIEKKIRVGEPVNVLLKAGVSDTVVQLLSIDQPKFWGPYPTQRPHRYLAVTTLSEGGRLLDRYETTFGLRDVRFDPNQGIFVNGAKIDLKGVNQHHDLGALGAAFNDKAALRQLEMLQDMGCNAVRMSHNPPAPELLDMTDRMGFLVIDEIFDCWQRKKTPLDFHLIFDDWSEQDLRAMIRRDKNHPSVVLWSFGNEVGEQYTGEEGAVVAKRLRDIVREEDASRPTIVAMNYAKPDMPLPGVADVIGLNYQGEGIRYDGPYAGLKGISTPPLFPAFHAKYPDKVILSTENASALSSRGEYLFPVYPGVSSPIKDGQGGNSQTHQVSAYELYSVEFGSSADKVFSTLEKHPFVAGGFAWTGWDYLGEPTPYYSSRSSYSGIIDLAGFKKDRFYLYQAYWRPDFPMVHLLPHWTWPDRLGQVTPVHVMTSGDAAELFLNGRSLGRKALKPFEHRLRWDSVCYEPGTLQVVAYKQGKRWATETVRTAGSAEHLELTADCKTLLANGKDLAFITLRVADAQGVTVPFAKQEVSFRVEGCGDLLATDNGDPSDLVSFASSTRKAFNGYALLIVRAKKGQTGEIRITAESNGLKAGTLVLKSIH